MSTRSLIGIQKEDGTIDYVYCHWDGYPSHNGRILLENYNTPESVEELLAPGDISSLDVRCDKPKGHSFENSVDGYTVYYGRDRGEKGCQKMNVANEEAFKKVDGWQEFLYLFKNGGWYYKSVYKSDNGKFKVLTAKVCERD